MSKAKLVLIVKTHFTPPQPASLQSPHVALVIVKSGRPTYPILSSNRLHGLLERVLDGIASFRIEQIAKGPQCLALNYSEFCIAKLLSTGGETTRSVL